MRYAMHLVLCIATTPLVAEELRCEDPDILVEAASREVALSTCKSAAAGILSLSSCGVNLKESLSIAVVDAINSETKKSLGRYISSEKRIEILSPKAMAAAHATDGAFSGVSDFALWDSVLVHELTHAAYQQVNCPTRSCIATSEYAGYVMQVLSLPTEERESWLGQFILKSEPSHDAITAQMYFMAPEHFAKLAWLHFSTRPNPCGYMALIMSGRVFFDSEPP